MIRNIKADSQIHQRNINTALYMRRAFLQLVLSIHRNFSQKYSLFERLTKSKELLN